MQKITLTSIQAPNQDWIGAALADYLERKLSIPTEFVHAPPWQDREQMLDMGEINIAWICGLPYIQRADQPGAQVELLVAPVMRPARYRNLPVYFSDVIVRRETPFTSFGDLRGVRWAYNEPNSHSGYNLTRYVLAQMGAFDGYFGSAIQAGSHQAALQMLLAGQIDATAIDSTVLEIELENKPEVEDRIRTVATWGPSPIPPWVVQKRLPDRLKTAIREILLGMEAEIEGRRVLASLRLKRFARVRDEDYNPIRAMFRLADRVRL
ncbi:MAG TPA: PhnD/SsuA/transferrin family substrate-binding protein [Anaerolineales bacterium]|nr:PhnD/SsuA/transferrin family substrate-binding protein [Anaerolineales bacterium]